MQDTHCIPFILTYVHTEYEISIVPYKVMTIYGHNSWIDGSEQLFIAYIRVYQLDQRFWTDLTGLLSAVHTLWS